jgi:hypothetical protein
MRFDTKIAVVVRTDLPVWQKLNVTAFTVSGIAATEKDAVGLAYEDGAGNRYLPMLGQPVLVFAAEPAEIATAYERLMALGIAAAIFTEELFATGNDFDNRAAVKAKRREELRLAGFAFRAPRRTADKVLAGLKLHR